MELYEHILICAYAHAALTWGLFAALMNTKIHAAQPFRKHAFCFFINIIGMPIAMTIAVLMLYGGKHDKYFIKP